jgi:hypothetical protein
MLRTILTSLSVLSSAMCVQAQPISLVEFTYEKVPIFGGVSPPPVRDWEFGFSASLSPDGVPPLFVWFDVYGTDDVGKTFPATAEIVEGAAQALASSSAVYGMSTAGLADPSALGRLMDWIATPCNPCAVTFVADPTNYRVTAVERVIDQLIVENTGFGTWIVGGKQTVRFSGEPIPEPSTIALWLTGVAFWMPSQIRRRTAPTYCVV